MFPIFIILMQVHEEYLLGTFASEVVCAGGSACASTGLVDAV